MCRLKMIWTITQLETSLVHIGKLAEQRSSCSRINLKSINKIEKYPMKILTFCLEWPPKSNLGNLRKLLNNPFSLMMKLYQVIWVIDQVSRKMRMKIIVKRQEHFCSVTCNSNLKELKLSQVAVKYFYLLTKEIRVIHNNKMEF